MTLTQELETLLAQRDKIRSAQVVRYAEGSASRARTTTSNANVDKLQERIEWLRNEIKKETQP